MAAAILELPKVEPLVPDIGFSSLDREVLTTVKVRLEFLVQTMQDALVRIQRLEENRLTARDLEELMSDTDTLRTEKKQLEAQLAEERKETNRRLTAVEQWQWKAGGAALAIGALSGFVARFIH